MPKLIRFLVLYLFVLMNFIPGHSQDRRVFRQMFKEAESILLYLDEEPEALKLFLELDRMDPGNAHIQYKIGICYLHIPGEKEKAIPYFQKASLQTSSDYSPVYTERSAPHDVLFYLGLACHISYRFEEAIEAYNRFIETADISSYYDVEFVREQINGCLGSMEMVRNPMPYRKEPAGRRINTHPYTFNPAVSGDGNSMVYTVKEAEGYRLFHTLHKGGQWGNPVDITGQLQTMGDGISSSLSNDGKILFIYRDDGGAGDLYVSSFSGGKWRPVERLNRNINTKYWESGCCLSPDGNTLYFSSNRKGGYGKLDLYRSERMPDGQWGPAKNMGPVINSPLNEDSPAISADGKILFFSSQGHGSMGGFDHFYSELSPNGRWTLPVNLGYPVSTPDDDLFLAPVGQGDTAYYAQFTEEIPAQKAIWQLILRGESVSPVTAATPATILPEITLKGKVKLQDDQQGADTSLVITVVDTFSRETVKTVRPAAGTGEYEISLPAGDYQIIYQAGGYERQEHLVSVAPNIPTKDIRVSTRLVPESVAKGEFLMIDNIYFGFDSWALDNEAVRKLERLAGIMQEHPMLEFELIGHTDTTGSASYNIVLSKRRANAVAAYLFGRGIEHHRLLTKGLGEIIALRKEEGMEPGDDDPRFYRRVEVKILQSADGQVLHEEPDMPEFLRSRLDLDYTLIVVKVPTRLPEDYFDQYGLDELRYVREQEVSDGFIYTLGSFSRKQRALQLLGELRSLGFREAQVVDKHELSDLVVGKDPDAGFFGRPEKIDEIPWYTIQVFALKKPPPPSVLRGKKEVTAYSCKDGLIRYATGKYKGYSQALRALPEVQKEWYKDAFIQELSRLEKGLGEQE